MPHDTNSDLIITDPAILTGKPVFAGTRISVKLILEKLGDGWTINDLLDDYSHISRESVIYVGCRARLATKLEEWICLLSEKANC